jgi:hypothetical protein
MGPDDVSIDGLLGRLDEFIEEGVDEEVGIYYSSILRTRTIAPVQAAFLATVYQDVLNGGYVRHRHLQREALATSKNFKVTPHFKLVAWQSALKTTQNDVAGRQTPNPSNTLDREH